MAWLVLAFSNELTSPCYFLYLQPFLFYTHTKLEVGLEPYASCHQAYQVPVLRWLIYFVCQFSSIIYQRSHFCYRYPRLLGPRFVSGMQQRTLSNSASSYMYVTRRHVCSWYYYLSDFNFTPINTYSGPLQFSSSCLVMVFPKRKASSKREAPISEHMITARWSARLRRTDILQQFGFVHLHISFRKYPPVFWGSIPTYAAEFQRCVILDYGVKFWTTPMLPVSSQDGNQLF